MRTGSRRFVFLFLVFSLSVLAQKPLSFHAPSTSVADSNIIIRWDNSALQAIRHAKPGPTVAARALSMLHTAMFDSWAAYDSSAVGTRLGGSLRRPSPERTSSNKAKAMSYTAHRVLVDLFPIEKPDFDDLMRSQEFDPDDPSVNPATPTGIGNIIATALLNYRHSDGSNQLGDLHPGAYSDYTGFVPVNNFDAIKNPDKWQPLLVPNLDGRFTLQKYETPQWGLVTPFALKANSQFRPERGPATYANDSKRYRKQVEICYA